MSAVIFYLTIRTPPYPTPPPRVMVVRPPAAYRRRSRSRCYLKVVSGSRGCVVVLGRVGEGQSCRGVVSPSRIGSGRRGPVVSGSRECRSYWVGSERTSRVGEL